MFFKIHVLYIEESGAVFGNDESVEKERIRFVTELCHKYGFDYTVIPIGYIYSPEPLPEQLPINAVIQSETQV